MEEPLEKGTEVLIINNGNDWDYNQDIENYIRGEVIKIERSGDLSHHGSPWYVFLYTVLGENGDTYFGRYGSYFITEEDYISYLYKLIADNEEQIMKMEKENRRFQRRISNIKKEAKQKTLTRTRKKQQ